MKGGGELIARTGSLMNGLGKNALLVISDSDGKSHRHSSTRTKKFKFIEPIQTKGVPRNGMKLHEVCPKCGDATNVDLKKLLKSVSMTKPEIDLVSQLYVSYSSYEKSVGAIQLPPLSDPIYKIPELPFSLRSSVEADYSVQ